MRSSIELLEMRRSTRRLVICIREGLAECQSEISSRCSSVVRGRELLKLEMAGKRENDLDSETLDLLPSLHSAGLQTTSPLATSFGCAISDMVN